jgi:hypothetical protein
MLKNIKKQKHSKSGEKTGEGLKKVKQQGGEQIILKKV